MTISIINGRHTVYYAIEKWNKWPTLELQYYRLMNLKRLFDSRIYFSFVRKLKFSFKCQMGRKIAENWSILLYHIKFFKSIIDWLNLVEELKNYWGIFIRCKYLIIVFEIAVMPLHSTFLVTPKTTKAIDSMP